MRLTRLPRPGVPSHRLLSVGASGLLAGLLGGWLAGLLRAPRQARR